MIRPAFRRLLLPTAILVTCCGPPSSGDIGVSVDKLDPSDGAGIPPSHLVVVDIAIEVTPDLIWNTLGMAGYTFGGGRFEYAHDPNTGDVLYTNPGTENRFVTFFSRPRPRNGDGRFGPNAAVQVGGSYCHGAVARFWETEIDANVGSIGAEPDRDGYVGRIVIDMSGFFDPRFRVDSDNIIIATEQPPGSELIFNTNCLGLEAGCRWERFRARAPTGVSGSTAFPSRPRR